MIYLHIQTQSIARHYDLNCIETMQYWNKRVAGGVSVDSSCKGSFEQGSWELVSIHLSYQYLQPKNTAVRGSK